MYVLWFGKCSLLKIFEWSRWAMKIKHTNVWYILPIWYSCILNMNILCKHNTWRYAQIVRVSVLSTHLEQAKWRMRLEKGPKMLSISSLYHLTSLIQYSITNLCTVDIANFSGLGKTKVSRALLHRDAAIMLIFLPIMLFRNAQNFVRLCLRWTPIMLKLFPNFL